MKKKTQTPTQQAWKRKAVLFLCSQGVSLFGSSLVQMALIWHVALETSSGIWVTLLTLSATVPQAVVSLFAGVWADRFHRKRMIILADASIALATLALAVCMQSFPDANLLSVIILASAIRSLATGIQTPAVNALLPQLVPEEHLTRFNGLNGSIQSVAQFAAPAAAGAILKLGSIASILYIDVVTAVIGICMLALIRVHKHTVQAGQGEGWFASIGHGIRYVAGQKAVRNALLAFGLFIFFSVPSGFLSVLMIERTFGGEIGFLTINEMAGFLGMVLGGVLLGVWGGFRQQSKTLAAGLHCYAVFSLGVSVTGQFWVFVACMFGMSLAIPAVQSPVMSTLQETVPEDMQGRVFGLLNVMYTGFMPLGMALFGPLADVVRIQLMVIACAVPILLLGIAALRTKAM